MSFRTEIRWLSMWTHPVRRRLAMSGLIQATFKVVVVWLGNLLSGHLHREAVDIEFAGKLFSFSILHRCSWRLGSKGPVQGMNRKITAKVRSRICALWLILLSRSVSLSIISAKRFLDSAESNLSNMAGRSKIDTLWTARDCAGGGCPSAITGVVHLSIQPLKHCCISFWALANFGWGCSPSSRGPYSIKSCLAAKETRWITLGSACVLPWCRGIAEWPCDGWGLLPESWG